MTNGVNDSGWPPVPKSARHDHSHGGSPARAGLVLIVIGLVFLVAQFLPGFAWWNLWPVVIIIVGVVSALTPGHEGWGIDRLFDGLVTVAFGLLLLAVTTGMVGWSVMTRLLSLWPLLLIAGGFGLLGKGLGSRWIGALGSIVIIGGMVWAFSAEMSGFDRVTLFTGAAGGSTPIEISEPVLGVSDANLKLEAGVTEITLSGGDQLFTARGSSPWGKPTFVLDRSGSSADITLATGDAQGTTVWPADKRAAVDVGLARDVTWQMDVTAGVAELHADLSDVPVRSFDLRPGVASCDLKFGELPPGVSEGTISVKSGVSSVTIALPDDVEASIESQSGLTGHDVSNAFESRGGGVWTTPGFEQARASGEDVWLVQIKSGIGSVVVDTY